MSPRRCSQRVKCIGVSPRKIVNANSPTVAVLKDSETLNNTAPEKKSSAAEDENNDDLLNTSKKGSTPEKVKRGKRSLTAERDKSSPLNVKVLRRSHTQNVEHADVADTQISPKSQSKRQTSTPTKLSLPAVKNTKTKP